MHRGAVPVSGHSTSRGCVGCPDASNRAACSALLAHFWADWRPSLGWKYAFKPLENLLLVLLQVRQGEGGVLRGAQLLRRRHQPVLPAERCVGPDWHVREGALCTLCAAPVCCRFCAHAGAHVCLRTCWFPCSAAGVVVSPGWCMALHLPLRQGPSNPPAPHPHHPALPQCVGDGQYGCNPARNASCCSFPFRQCGEGISGFQCKKGCAGLAGVLGVTGAVQHGSTPFACPCTRACQPAPLTVHKPPSSHSTIHTTAVTLTIAAPTRARALERSVWARQTAA